MEFYPFRNQSDDRHEWVVGHCTYCRSFLFLSHATYRATYRKLFDEEKKRFAKNDGGVRRALAAAKKKIFRNSCDADGRCLRHEWHLQLQESSKPLEINGECRKCGKTDIPVLDIIGSIVEDGVYYCIPCRKEWLDACRREWDEEDNWLRLKGIIE